MRGYASAACLLAAILGFPRAAEAVASAELYRTQAYVYGRFEARIRYAAGDGVISSFFLWKEGSEVSGTFWNELDFEKLGADCHMQTNAIYGNPSAEHSQTNAMPGDICAGYHDYRFEWTPTYIAWSVDGQEIRRETGATATAFSQNATRGMTFHFNIWPGNANFGGNFNPAILPVREYISWVQYSSYNNGAFQLGWREEFDGGSLPSGWATGTWASPYSLSTHNPANVRFVNGIAILSLTADNATGSPGTPPADIAITGGTGTGGTNAGGASAGGASTGGALVTGGALNRGGASAVTGGTPSNTGGKSPATGGSANAGGTTMSQGGIATGGSSNSGGIAASGGTSPSTGGSTTSSTTQATGGILATVGGGASTSTHGGTQGTAVSNSATDPGGCGCHVVGENSNGLVPTAFGLLGLLLTQRRRTRSKVAGSLATG